MEFKRSSSRPLIIAIVIIVLALICVTVLAVLWATRDDDDDCPSGKKSSPTTLYKSGHGTYNYAAVSADSDICSSIGTDILARRRGNAVDAAVATVLCTGVVQPQSIGIGGGSFFVVYIKKEDKFYALNSRETAPARADENMFYKKEDRGKSLLGGLAAGIPGEVKGLYELHKRFGSIPWSTLVTPTIKLLEDGFPLTVATHHALHSKEVQDNKNRPGFEIYLDNKQQPKPAGSIIRNYKKLAETFKTIANDPMSFYNGSLAQDIVKDIQEQGGIIGLDDLRDYKVVWKEPTRMGLPGDLTLYSMPPPGSGAVLSYILSILAGYNMDADSIATDEAKILTYHRIVEAWKFAYGKRSALGDEDFVDVKELVQNLTSRSFGEQTRLHITDDKTQKLEYYDPAFYNVEDAGTSHTCVMDGEGNAVSVTSTINTYFGSKVFGNLTGILFNNEMDDFSTPNLTNSFGFPPSATNFIVPGKRPQSSMTPSIVFDNKEKRVRMLAGVAGGSRITTTVSWLIMNTLYFKRSLPEAMDLPRFHHQLLPMEVVVEKEMPEVIKSGLKAKGHKITETDVIAYATTLEALANSIVAVADFREGGQPGGY